jgi:hypothetical protein
MSSTRRRSMWLRRVWALRAARESISCERVCLLRDVRSAGCQWRSAPGDAGSAWSHRRPMDRSERHFGPVAKVSCVYRGLRRDRRWNRDLDVHRDVSSYGSCSAVCSFAGLFCSEVGKALRRTVEARRPPDSYEASKNIDSASEKYPLGRVNASGELPQRLMPPS